MSHVNNVTLPFYNPKSHIFYKLKQMTAMQTSGYSTLAAVAKRICWHVRLAHCFTGINADKKGEDIRCDILSFFICYVWQIRGSALTP